MSNIKPELPGGFKDYLPGEQKKRQEILNVLIKNANLFGFLPVDTPAVEKKEILTEGDGEIEKQIFEIDRDDEKQSMALRFDLTVPLARLMASYPNDLDKPFKRYQYGRVWRGEKPQAGRYREFLQFDVDVVGSPNILSDAEVINFVYKSLRDLDIPKFTIRLNNRKILSQLPKLADFKEELLVDVLRAIDKLKKIGWDGVEEELSDIGLNEKQVKVVKEFIELSNENTETIIASVRGIFEEAGADLEGVEETEKLAEYLYSFDVPKEYWRLDLSIARGLDYYTGPIFEIELDDSDIGSISAGGRYDNLMEKFSGSPMPAVGISVGVDRLISALKEKDNKTSSDVLVLNFDKSSVSYCVSILNLLRKEGVSSEIYNGQEDTLKGQLSYGVKRGFPVILIAGSDEKDKNVVQVKDVKDESQSEVNFDNVVEKVKEIL